MNSKRLQRVQMGTFAVLAAVMMLATPAYAFFPMGGFDPNGNFFVLRWAFSDLDHNGDGDVSGDNDGVRFNFESGANGFTASEIAQLRAGFERWETVPTSYMAFSYGPNIDRQLDASPDLGAIDAFNFVAARVGDDPGDLSAIVGETYVTSVLEDTFIELANGETVFVKGPRIIDVDMLIDMDEVRTGDLAPLISLEGIGVTLSGLAAGLGFSPMDNFNTATVNGTEVQIDPRVVTLRAADGTLRQVGVTPSMRPDAFFYDEGGTLLLATTDLAPDDIAGISFMYPRGEQTNFFEVRQEARTRTRRDFPSVPIAGGLIIAWADADNNPSTGRVPMFSTMGGLYETQEHLRGRFRLPNLFKRLETNAGQLFNVSYTFSHHEFVPTTGSRQDYDSTHGGSIFDTGQDFTGFSYEEGYPAEVFNEFGNFFGLGNKDNGTPLFYDPIRRRVASTFSGKTLEEILPSGRPLTPGQPMFGDPTGVCFWNQVIAGTAPMQTPSALRRLRDNVLLQSAVGAALVDTYYRVSPAIVHEMLTRGAAWETGMAVAIGIEWLFQHRFAALLFVLMALGLSTLGWRRMRRAAAAAGIGALIIAIAGAPTAYALMKLVSTPDMVKHADDIVIGTVANVESHWDDEVPNRIVTDITIEVGGTLKGGLNKSSLVHLRQIGGQIGAVVTKASHSATFARGEEVLVFLAYSPENGYRVLSGSRGKYQVETDEDTGQKFLRPPGIMADLGLNDVREKIKAAKSETDEGAVTATRVSLDEFTGYVRALLEYQQVQEAQEFQE